MTTEIDKDTIERLKSILMKLVPDNGTAIGNVTLIELFIKEVRKQKIRIKKEYYWDVRNQLILDGLLEKGRGRGGSVYKIPLEPTPLKKGKSDFLAMLATSTFANHLAEGEANLYAPFRKMLAEYWTKDIGLKDGQWIVEETANQGGKQTGGKWTRPDITLVAIRDYEFIPTKTIEITTFEIKPTNYNDIKGVYETASHNRFANYSYLAIKLTESDEKSLKDEKDIKLERLRQESKRFGIGLIVFSDSETVEVVVDPIRNNPDPDIMDEFLRVQISKPNQEKLRKLVG